LQARANKIEAGIRIDLREAIVKDTDKEVRLEGTRAGEMEVA
jgi:hypothetical protein